MKEEDLMATKIDKLAAALVGKTIERVESADSGGIRLHFKDTSDTIVFDAEGDESAHVVVSHGSWQEKRIL